MAPFDAQPLSGAAGEADVEEAPQGFRRLPTWMWRNAEPPETYPTPTAP